MEITEIERLVELVQNSCVGELTLREGTSRITIRTGNHSKSYGNALVHQPVNTQYVEASEYTNEESDSLSYQIEDEDPEHFTICAPSVGIFKCVKPVVGLRASVSEGQVVGVIEAMKLFNDVVCASDGIIIDVLVEDSMPVEYGQPLYLVQPAN